MLYNINIKAEIESSLSQAELESQLVVALYNVDNQHSKLDGVDDGLEVLEYELTEAIEMCPHCKIDLVSRVFDVDGINLVEHVVCDECGYGSPSLL